MKFGQAIERLKGGAAIGKRSLAFGGASQADSLQITERLPTTHQQQPF